MTKTYVEIFNRDGERVATVRNFYPLNDDGHIIRYSKELSDWGKCNFRIASEDPLLQELGDFLVPHKYSVKVKRGNKYVWSGSIINNPRRNKKYIEVEAGEYLFYLSKILIRRDTEASTGDGLKHFRKFDSGTMSSAISTIISQAASDFGTDHILGGMTAGTIQNPNYPDGFTDASGDPLTGAWNFTSDITVQFDYHSALYVLTAFGIYSDYDFELTEDLVFNFKKKIGNKLPNVVFEYGTRGNVVDYELPRYGQRMANDITGIAALVSGFILHSNVRDEASIQEYGMMQDIAAFSDVKNKNILAKRLREEMRFVKSPEVSPVNMILDEKGYPLGVYDIGDTVTVKISDHNINYKASRRVVGITVNVHNTGRELTVVQTNAPRPEQDD